MSIFAIGCIPGGLNLLVQLKIDLYLVSVFLFGFAGRSSFVCSSILAALLACFSSLTQEGAAGIEEIPSQFCSAVASSTDNKSAQQPGEADVLAQYKPTMEKLTKLSFMISHSAHFLEPALQREIWTASLWLPNLKCLFGS
ncbi:uncharacterized protein LOC125531887 [Triticum urartu]|uniref:uncharacterized protein LOC125531887 n=1 Tax=Triticum urartu TaxID=4572 RepID=UPI002044898A|nr:uncharacterized protein LOC125531887 [Triticum urartu]